jgi:hypothetical protein
MPPGSSHRELAPIALDARVSRDVGVIEKPRAGDGTIGIEFDQGQPVAALVEVRDGIPLRVARAVVAAGDANTAMLGRRYVPAEVVSFGEITSRSLGAGRCDPCE